MEQVANIIYSTIVFGGIPYVFAQFLPSKKWLLSYIGVLSVLFIINFSDYQTAFSRNDPISMPFVILGLMVIVFAFSCSLVRAFILYSENKTKKFRIIVTVLGFIIVPIFYSIWGLTR